MHIKVQVDTCAQLSALADPKDKDPYVKIHDGGVWLSTSGSVAFVAYFQGDSGIDGVEVSVPIKALSRALTPGSVSLKGRSVGGVNAPLRIQQGTCRVDVPTKPQEQYPLNNEYLKTLEARFNEKHSLKIPGTPLHGVLTSAVTGLEPPNPQFPYTECIALVIDEAGGLCAYALSDRRAVRTGRVVAYQEGEGPVDATVFLFPRKAAEALAYMVAKNFGSYEIHIDSLQNPVLCKAVFAEATLYFRMPEESQVGADALSSFIEFVYETLDSWIEVQSTVVEIPDMWNGSLSYIAGQIDSEMSIHISKGSLVIETLPNSPVQIRQEMPFAWTDDSDLKFRTTLQTLATAPSSYMYPVVEKDTGKLLQLWMLSSRDNKDTMLLHSVYVRDERDNMDSAEAPPPPNEGEPDLSEDDIPF